MKVSIIIPVKGFNQNLDECLKHCLKLDYRDYEIIILPDSSMKLPYNGVRIIPTGVKGPSEKRNLGIKEAKGEIVAFLDDDTFPPQGWLKKVAKNFEDEDIAAVGGPAVTPESDGLLEKASGDIYSSLLGGGVYRYRYLPQKRRLVDDFPSCNFIVRKSILKEIGGFKTRFWPGEDTAICLGITKDLGKKIVYDPEVLIYHHRRRLFIPHLKQVCNYALHRGYFAKRFPQTSLRISYFLPTFFVLGLLFGWFLGFIRPLFYKIYFITILTYLFMALLTGLKNKLPLSVFSGLILTHLCYGIWFLKGLFSRRLKEE
jgi:cellulose synthase/poly-beta-1,6-N-acetylglucosamine synthase-like glycosyltransferase